uniref:Uncharacterized protein n=1 Tax=Brassica campestris TaxID=3711 RepID=M4DVX5_BRACM
MGNNIYNAPRAEGVDFLVYHAVITESVMLYRGEYVAYCKMSNGVDADDESVEKKEEEKEEEDKEEEKEDQSGEPRDLT